MTAIFNAWFLGLLSGFTLAIALVVYKKHTIKKLIEAYENME